jgi:hypothetical protein
VLRFNHCLLPENPAAKGVFSSSQIENVPSISSSIGEINRSDYFSATVLPEPNNL